MDLFIVVCSFLILYDGMYFGIVFFFFCEGFIVNGVINIIIVILEKWYEFMS